MDSQKAMETLDGGSTPHAGFISDTYSNSPVYVYLGLGTIIRPPKASYRTMRSCFVDHCSSNDHYSGEDFVPKDLLNFGSTCKKLCLEIRPPIFSRSTLLLTTSQLECFHTYSFRHQLLGFWPWFYVRKLVLHILWDDTEGEARKQLHILGKLDLSKVELVILYSCYRLRKERYYVDISRHLRPLSGAHNIRFETCSNLRRTAKLSHTKRIWRR